MKAILPLLVLVSVACNNTVKKENVDLQGTWKMLSQNLTSGSTDSAITTLQQLKIFTERHLMYANVNTPDSVSSFGVGYYEVKADTIVEHIIYSSSDSIVDDTVRTYSLFIEKTDKGYRQVIPDVIDPANGRHYKLSEEYEPAATVKTSELDGLWKLTKAIMITGTDTVPQELTQYKMIYGGMVLWAHTVKDSLGKYHTGVGFGPFEMSGSNKAKESITTSTYSQARGLSFDLEISHNGFDEFTQTIIERNGSKGIETYRRVK